MSWLVPEPCCAKMLGHREDNSKPRILVEYVCGYFKSTVCEGSKASPSPLTRPQHGEAALSRPYLS